MRDQTEAIIDAIDELETEPPGDVLVFLSGEREIRDTAEALRASEEHRGVAALRAAADRRTAAGVRAAHRPPGRARHQRRRDVADRARHPLRRRPRHRANLALQPPDEGAAAADRADLAGLGGAARGPLGARGARRVHPAVLRGRLRVTAALHRPRDPAHQPRRGDPADGGAANSATSRASRSSTRRIARSIRDGVQLLQELGAFDQRRRDHRRRPPARTVAGRSAPGPDDPGRPTPRAACARCSCSRPRWRFPDPRERPADQEEAARQKHARFADEHSDFVSYLNLWRYLREQRKERSGNSFRRMCREEFLHYLRIREWQDLVGQLRSIARDMGIREQDEPADAARVHAAVTAGLLSHIGLREGRFARVPGRTQLEVRARAGLGADQAARRAGSSSPTSSRPAACTDGSPHASNRRRSNASRPTWCSARTASRTGTPSAAR